MVVTGNDQTRSGENCTHLCVGAFTNLEAFQIPSFEGGFMGGSIMQPLLIKSLWLLVLSLNSNSFPLPAHWRGKAKSSKLLIKAWTF